jgi:peptidoglycan/xylan/chitin deacetylase (PgdA/CDA1 family)
LPELRNANAPATFFLCGSFLADQPRDFWWQRLQRAVNGGVDVAPLVGTGTIREMGRAMEAMEPDMRDQVAQEISLLTGASPANEFLSEQDAHQLPHIGFHTRRHDPLPRLDDERLELALTDGRAGLADVAGYSIDTIAYPHGLFDSRVVEAARKSDFAIGVTCKRHAVTPGSDPLALGRYEAPAHGPMGVFAYDLVRTLLISPA